MYEYKGVVRRVVDGDTFDISVDVGFSIVVEHRFRLKDFDTPETYRPSCEAELVHGREATAFVKALIEGKTVMVRTYKLAAYGRYEADILLINEQGDVMESLATLLGKRGFAKGVYQ